MKKTMIHAAFKNIPLACLTLLLILSSASSGQTTEPTTQPVLTLEQQISALDSRIDSRANPPTPEDRGKLAMQRFQLRQQLSQEEAIKNAPRLAAEKAAKDARAAADKAKTDKASQATTAIQPSQPSNSAIANAIKAKKLAVGMTMDEAKRALGDGLLLVSEDESGKIYKWILSQYDGTNLVGRAYVFAKFTDEKVTGWQQVSKDVVPLLQ